MPDLNRFPLADEWKDYVRVLTDLSAVVRRNQAASTRYKDYFEYVENWPIALDALRKLWEMGKVSELKTPFYEPFEKSAKQ